jgi:hypothetical protein
MSPDLIVDAVRLIAIVDSPFYEDDTEIDRLGPLVDRARARYDGLSRRGFGRANLISKAEALAVLLGIDGSGIEAEVDARIARQRAAVDAELRAEIDAEPSST